MHEDLIKRLREFASIPEHCENVTDCNECSKEEICLSFTNKLIIEVATQAADAIEELTAYVQQIEELRKDGYYLQKTKMLPYGQSITTTLLPQPPKKVGKLHVDKHGVVSITEIPEVGDLNDDK